MTLHTMLLVRFLGTHSMGLASWADEADGLSFVAVYLALWTRAGMSLAPSPHGKTIMLRRPVRFLFSMRLSLLAGGLGGLGGSSGGQLAVSGSCRPATCMSLHPMHSMTGTYTHQHICMCSVTRQITAQEPDPRHRTGLRRCIKGRVAKPSTLKSTLQTPSTCKELVQS